MSVLARNLRRLEVPRDHISVFAADAIAGLSATPKRLPSKYFYDKVGSDLFEEITRLPEYYPTSTELNILNGNAEAIAALIPAGAVLVELGSGPTIKVRLLLRATPDLFAYVPVDISPEFLDDEAATLRQEFPTLAVLPVVADFTRPFDLPAAAAARACVGFFPGSTIGNFEPLEATALLHHALNILGPGSTFIVGVDLVKDIDVLHAAYNDAAGVTAKFNLNLLARINRELDGDFDLAAFEHRAIFNRELRRIEMHLVSRKAQSVRVAGAAIDFGAGETIHTENSYKYTIESFSALARGAGWTPGEVWTDASAYFSVHALRAAPAPATHA